MEYSIYLAKDFETINWAGGTSTQLFIYPESGDYKERNFDFRLSTAKVELEKSDFTPLPGVSRHLMILDGEIEITHRDQYSKTLKQFDTDRFEGEWHTSSVGQCTDFNLMCKNGREGEISSFHLPQGESSCQAMETTWKWLFLYVHSGDFDCQLGNESFMLSKGSLLRIQQMEGQSLKISARESGQIIVSKLK